ncbi:MAG: hypothetical protein M3072_17790 [Candidatus Dormibacteraeota bacterium]|nr:hypothetical protein [Candidatus Dormibacteraeota bacterium]
MSIIEAATGEITPAEIFVSVLGATGMLYVEASRGQDLKSWLLAHVRAWEAYAGVARVTVPDNLKSGITKACWYEPEVNPSYLELARRYNTVILPTRTAKPRDKAAVESGVQVTERWVLAPLRNRRFFSLGELNQAIAEKVAGVNVRQFRGQPSSRRDLFLERRGSWGFSAPRFSEAPSRSASAVTLGCQRCHHRRHPPPSLTVEIQAAETPENSGRFNLTRSRPQRPGFGRVGRRPDSLCQC